MRIVKTVLEELLLQLRVANVKWAADGRLLIDLVCGSCSWGQLRHIGNERFAELAQRVRRVALDTGSGVLDCWWDVHADCGAGFAPPKEGKEEGWGFAFQVRVPPEKREQSWQVPSRVAFQLVGGRQMIIRGKEP